MPEIWIPEAEDLKAAGTSGTMSGKGGPRATAHCTVSRPDQFDDMHRVLTGKEAEPHLLYSFVDDRLGQYFGLDRSARALMGANSTPSGVSHNKVGTVNIQIEFVGSTDDWTARPDWHPGPNFRAMMRAIASWGIKPEFIFRPATTSLDRANVVRSFATMTGDAGGGKWWGHCHYPDGESHWDPGRLNVAKFFAAAGTITPPAPGVYPGYALKRGDTGPKVAELQTALGLTADGSYGPGTEAAVTAYQTAHGLQVDGITGPATWASIFTQEDDMALDPTERAALIKDITAAIWTGTTVSRDGTKVAAIQELADVKTNGLALDARIATLEAAVGVLANSQGLNPDLIAKLITDAVNRIDIKAVVTEGDPA